MKQFRIRKDDVVVVVAGDDKGKIGRVVKIFRKKNAVLVEKVNMVKRHTKPNPHLNQPGGIIDKEMPLDVSNVMLKCPSCGKPVRVRFEYSESNGKKQKLRMCQKCDKTIG